MWHLNWSNPGINPMATKKKVDNKEKISSLMTELECLRMELDTNEAELDALRYEQCELEEQLEKVKKQLEDLGVIEE